MLRVPTQQNKKKKHQRIGRKWRKTFILAIKINRQNKGNEINLELITYNVPVLPIAVWCGALRIIIISSGTFFLHSSSELHSPELHFTEQQQNKTRNIYEKKMLLVLSLLLLFCAYNRPWTGTVCVNNKAKAKKNTKYKWLYRWSTVYTV